MYGTIYLLHRWLQARAYQGFAQVGMGLVLITKTWLKNEGYCIDDLPCLGSFRALQPPMSGTAVNKAKETSWIT